MSPRGHYLTALTAGIAATAVWMHAGTGADAPGVAGGAALMGGFILGSRAPDVLEIASFVGGKRVSVIPHRTLTHWIPLWILALVGVYMLWRSPHTAIWSRALVTGFCLAGGLHVLMDFMSPTGVPLLLPTARHRVRMPVYHTGKIGEQFVVMAFIAVVSFSTLFFYFVPYSRPPW